MATQLQVSRTFRSPTSFNPLFYKPLCGPGNLPISRVICGKNKALTEVPDMEKNLQKVNIEFRIGKHPSEKCMTGLAELKSPNSNTERNANI